MTRPQWYNSMKKRYAKNEKAGTRVTNNRGKFYTGGGKLKELETLSDGRFLLGDKDNFVKWTEGELLTRKAIFDAQWAIAMPLHQEIGEISKRTHVASSRN